MQDLYNDNNALSLEAAEETYFDSIKQSEARPFHYTWSERLLLRTRRLAIDYQLSFLIGSSIAIQYSPNYRNYSFVFTSDPLAKA